MSELHENAVPLIAPLHCVYFCKKMLRPLDTAGLTAESISKGPQGDWSGCEQSCQSTEGQKARAALTQPCFNEAGRKESKETFLPVESFDKCLVP